MADVDLDLEAALAASVADAAQPLRIKHSPPPLQRTTGVCEQRNLLNQFHDSWQAAIQKHHTANAICGYMTIAHVRLMRALLTGAPCLRQHHLFELGDALMATAELAREVERAMASIARRRASYVAAHPDDFDQTSAALYLKAWVANYEISDELHKSLDSLAPVAPLFAPAEQPHAPPPCVHFARFNEWVSLHEATHEERGRILSEQSRFGGRVDERGVAHFGEGDSAVILERLGFRGAERLHELLTPPEWSAAERADGHDAGAPRVWAVDTSGHFYAALTCRVDGEDVLLAFNTTSANYLAWPMAGMLHGLVFGSAPVADGAEPDAQSAVAVAELVTMGFEEAAARAALAQVGGSLSSAVEVLVG